MRALHCYVKWVNLGVCAKTFGTFRRETISAIVPAAKESQHWLGDSTRATRNGRLPRHGNDHGMVSVMASFTTELRVMTVVVLYNFGGRETHDILSLSWICYCLFGVN